MEPLEEPGDRRLPFAVPLLLIFQSVVTRKEGGGGGGEGGAVGNNALALRAMIRFIPSFQERSILMSMDRSGLDFCLERDFGAEEWYDQGEHLFAQLSLCPLRRWLW